MDLASSKLGVSRQVKSQGDPTSATETSTGLFSEGTRDNVNPKYVTNAKRRRHDQRDPSQGPGQHAFQKNVQVKQRMYAPLRTVNKALSIPGNIPSNPPPNYELPAKNPLDMGPANSKNPRPLWQRFRKKWRWPMQHPLWWGRPKPKEPMIWEWFSSTLSTSDILYVSFISYCL